MDNTPLSLIFRADFSILNGTGHFMRCVSLAQAWKRQGGRPVFIIGTDNKPVKERLEKEHIAFREIDHHLLPSEDARATIAFAIEEKSPAVVLDGLCFDTAYHQAIMEANIKLVLLDDDGHHPFYRANIILNQNYHASSDLYLNRSPSARLLLGLQYVLLREEFLTQKPIQKQVPDCAQAVLLTCGGSDLHNATLSFMDVMQHLNTPDIHLTVLVGANNSSHQQIIEQANHATIQTRVIYNTDAIASCMQQSDLCISAGGTTVWELAYLGIPNAVIRTNHLENLLVDGVREMDLLVDLGDIQHLHRPKTIEVLRTILMDRKKRQHMHQLGPAIIDGDGGDRVAQTILEVIADV